MYDLGMKVFVVTDGAYSGYHIVGIFSSREKANEKCPAAASEIKYASIEEWELDTVDDEGFLQAVYGCDIDIDTGRVETYGIPEHEKACATEFHPKYWSETYENPYYKRIQARSVISYEHALKLATEGRQNYLRVHA